MGKRVPAIERLDVPSSGIELLAAADGAAKPRSYKMVGYTGGEVDRWYGRVIIDTAGMEVAPNLPGFVEHDRDRRACFGTGKIADGKLIVTGTVLDNEHGQALSRDADQGFPFQASIGVQYLRMEELREGDEKTVNGRAFRGPGYIATKSRVFECSPVSLGADGKTRTSFLAQDRDGPTVEVESLKKETPDMDANQIEAAKAEALAAERKRTATIREALKDHPDVALAAIEAGESLSDAKARLAEKLAKVNAEQAARIEKLERAAAAPAVGFAGGKREDSHGAPATEDLAALPVEERAAKEWSRDPKVRDEFSRAGGKDAYAAYLAAEKAGRCAIYEPAHGKYGR